MKHGPYSIAVIGGGFYGCSIAEFLAARGASVCLIEREPELLGRSSYRNQARLHGGYHYPRSFGTAYRSRLNLPRFMAEYREAVVTDGVSLYAVARVGSKVNARQFEAFCRNIEAPARPARKAYARLFKPALIEAVYEVEEFAFDSRVVRRLLEARLKRAAVEVRLGQSVAGIVEQADGTIAVVCADGSEVAVSRVFNCTYAGVNGIRGLPPTGHRIKHEITEMALVQVPPELAGVSVTVMDGPFFSIMPFPDRRLATLSHVRYTPHAGWLENDEGPAVDPYATLAAYPKRTRFPQMVRDATRYLPAAAECAFRESLFEVKTVLLNNEADDGRPILFEPGGRNQQIVSVVGSKIDNIYDALAAVDICMREPATVH